jgi:uncharacterized protein with NAD-binding domain and iron-sulfur cluster
MTTVAVLGGGVGGLTAAHELADRGFDVTVVEWREAFGGKARSMDVPGSATGGRKPLPGEHGFRFFPGFYRHIPDTMSRIPNGNRTVVDHLVPSTRILLAQEGGRPEIVGIAERPSALNDFAVAIKFLQDLAIDVRVPPDEFADFAKCLLILLCACDERRYEQFDLQSWWDFTGAAHKSEEFRKFLAKGMTRTLVAARAEEMSARTGGLILCQLAFDLVRADGRLSRVLDGPTSERWIDPWVSHLTGRGVTLRTGCEIAGIDCDGHRVTGVAFTSSGNTERIVADHYVCALPKERLQLLLSPELRAAEPRLEAIPRLVTRWMNGLMFYLKTDVPMQHGHSLFIDSKWALTAISQAQFWRPAGIDLTDRGDGQVKGILSVDISDWTTPGLNGMVATACSADEVSAEVWRQITAAIDDGSLDKANVHSWFLDPAIHLPNASTATNLEPLLINTKGSWADRPEAVTRIPNFFLAADFVRTYTDLATMEAANEAARRAVNGILDATGSNARRCDVWNLREPLALAPFRALDRLRWQLGRPPATPPVHMSAAGNTEPSGLLAGALLKIAGWFS